MAKQTGQFPFTGRVGNMIGYKRNGSHFMRSMPDSVQQTRATRKAAKNFGIASSKAALLRRAMAEHLDVRGDNTHINRLNKTLIQSGIPGLTGFRFNKQTGLDTFFLQAPQLSADYYLQVPPQILPSVSVNAASLELKFIALKIDFESRHVTGTASQLFNIPVNQPFSGLKVDANVKGKGTLVVALQVRVINKDKTFTIPTNNGPIPEMSWYTNDRRYYAVDLIGIVPPVISPAAKKNVKKQSSSVNGPLPTYHIHHH